MKNRTFNDKYIITFSKSVEAFKTKNIIFES